MFHIKEYLQCKVMWWGSCGNVVLDPSVLPNSSSWDEWQQSCEGGGGPLCGRLTPAIVLPIVAHPLDLGAG